MHLSDNYYSSPSDERYISLASSFSFADSFSLVGSFSPAGNSGLKDSSSLRGSFGLNDSFDPSGFGLGGSSSHYDYFIHGYSFAARTNNRYSSRKKTPVAAVVPGSTRSHYGHYSSCCTRC